MRLIYTPHGRTKNNEPQQQLDQRRKTMRAGRQSVYGLADENVTQKSRHHDEQRSPLSPLHRAAPHHPLSQQKNLSHPPHTTPCRGPGGSTTKAATQNSAGRWTSKTTTEAKKNACSTCRAAKKPKPESHWTSPLSSQRPTTTTTTATHKTFLRDMVQMKTRRK